MDDKKYLFFDIECCDGRHMCEFGHVVIDSNFNIVDKGIIIINPQMPFNLFSERTGKGVHLFYEVDDYTAYKEGKTFDKYYQDIKDIIQEYSPRIIGYDNMCDARFLFKACERYEKEHIDYKFYDAQRVYGKFNGDHDKISLGKLVAQFDFDTSHLHAHKSDDDAEFTMLAIKGMCQASGVGIEEILKTHPNAQGTVKDGKCSFPQQLIKEVVKKN